MNEKTRSERRSRVKRRPRVVHVVRSLEIGGLERLVCDLVLGSTGFSAAVVCLTKVGVFGEMLRSQGVTVAAIEMNANPLRTVSSLCAQFRALRPDVVHCHNLLAHLYGSVCARLCGVGSVVFSKHGTHFPLSTPSGRLNLALLRYSHTVAVSEEIRTICIRRFRLGRGRVRYIPNGLSLRPYAHLPPQAEARARLGFSGTDFLVGVVARLAPDKGHSMLFKAFQHFVATVHRARLVVVGDGPERTCLEQSVVGLGLSEFVDFLGARGDVPLLLAALDVFVLPSLNEGIPMTVLEAMAASLPVVATRVGGVPQVVIDDETGVLVQPAAPDALAQALFRLYRDPHRARQMGVLGRRRVEDHFDLPRMVEQYELLYSRLLGRNG